MLYELAVTIAAEVNLTSPARADFKETPEAFHRTFLPALYGVLGDERRPVLLLDEFDVLDLAGERDLSDTAAARAFRPYLRRLLTNEPRLAFVFVVGRRMDELWSNSSPHSKLPCATPCRCCPPKRPAPLSCWPSGRARCATRRPPSRASWP